MRNLSDGAAILLPNFTNPLITPEFGENNNNHDNVLVVAGERTATAATTTSSTSSASAENLLIASATKHLTAECVDIKAFLWRNSSDLTYLPSTMGVFALLYSVIIILGVFGNSLVIISVVRHRNLQSVRNIFIVALSTSDIIGSIVSGTITPITGFSKVWLFGNFLCKLVPVIQGSSLCFSTLTLTAIAIDRFILIIFPMRRSIDQNMAFAMIAGNCFIAALVSLPMYFKQTLRDYLDFCGEFCAEDWNSNDQGRSIYGTFVFVVQFVVPLIVIFSCYLMIWLRLNHSVSMIKKPLSVKIAKTTNGVDQQRFARDAKGVPPLINKASSGALDNPVSLLNGDLHTTRSRSSPRGKRNSSSISILEIRNQVVIRRRLKTNRMLIAMVAQFGLCWTPAVAFNFLRDYQWLPDFIHGQEYLAGILTHCISISSTLWNPILYALFNEHFRTAFAELFDHVQLFICPQLGRSHWEGGGSRRSTAVGWRRFFERPGTCTSQELGLTSRSGGGRGSSSCRRRQRPLSCANIAPPATLTTNLTSSPSQQMLLMHQQNAEDTVNLNNAKALDIQRQHTTTLRSPFRNNNTLAHAEHICCAKRWPPGGGEDSSMRKLSVISSRSAGSLLSLSLTDNVERQTPIFNESSSQTAQEGDEML